MHSLYTLVSSPNNVSTGNLTDLSVDFEIKLNRQSKKACLQQKLGNHNNIARKRQSIPKGKMLVFKITKNKKRFIKKYQTIKYCCNFQDCNRVYYEKWLLHRHLICHLTGIKNFHCPHENCDKVYKSKENMLFHYSNFHLKQKAFKCEYCSKLFSHRNGRAYHERKKHQEKLIYKCTMKGKKIFHFLSNTL